ncbi:MAG: diaminopimelate decarboxylase [Candidatus Omnitrophica bacterium]|nr:diaminopimelate decarboxylase [Candidatus Omnitrophota bacterium]MBU0880987.1 diaminopimelate decarboxylase [Candidatus Omnitrophota bacterium]MBU1808414.1 diaminopimelate decarboxylase [Candidatus Omnitrophota bacterium]
MHEFSFRNNEFYCEDIKIADIAARVGTPFYLYSYKTLIDHYKKLKTAFQPIKPLISFSMKSNSNLAVIRALVKNGAGLDVVSGGELYRARLAGVNPKKVVYAGVGKRSDEIKDAIEFGILFFNTESEDELEEIQSIAGKLNRKVNVAIRINPDVIPKTHHYIATGKGESKFGLDFDTAHKIFNMRWKYPNLNINGVHVHIGSQILDAKPFEDAIEKVLEFLKARKIDVEYFNIGGGLGIIYSIENPQTAKSFAQKVIPLLKKSRLKIILEPGRFVSGNSGVLVTRVIYTKRTPRKKFVIMDSGMSDLIRPSLYEAYHKIVPVKVAENSSETCEKVDIVGPICESGDFLGKDRLLPQVFKNDLLAVMGAGAYGFTMASNYNARPRPAEVMVINKDFYVIRKHETYRDLVRGETIPKVLK